MFNLLVLDMDNDLRRRSIYPFVMQSEKAEFNTVLSRLPVEVSRSQDGDPSVGVPRPRVVMGGLIEALSENFHHVFSVASLEIHLELQDLRNKIFFDEKGHLTICNPLKLAA